MKKCRLENDRLCPEPFDDVHLKYLAVFRKYALLREVCSSARLFAKDGGVVRYPMWSEDTQRVTREVLTELFAEAGSSRFLNLKGRDDTFAFIVNGLMRCQHIIRVFRAKKSEDAARPATRPSQ